MPQWRKLWLKTTESDDVNDMPDDFTRLLWILLPLILDREGRMLDNPALVHARAMPLRMDVDNEMVAGALDWYANRGMIVRYAVNGRRYFYLPTFAKHQGNTSREADSVYPAPPAAEVATDSVVAQEGVGSRSGVTREQVTSGSGAGQEQIKDSDADTEAEGEAEREPAAQAPRAAEPPPARRPAKRHAVPDEITVFREVTGRYPPKALFGKVTDIVRNKNDPTFMQECFAAWVAHGWNPQNLAWLTEWYVAGCIPQPNKNGARASPGEPAGYAGIREFMAKQRAKDG